MKALLTSLALLFPTTLLARGQEPDPGGRDLRETIEQEELEELTAAIKLEIEKMRGKRFPRAIRVAVKTSEEFLGYAKEQLAKDSTPEEVAAEEISAKLLGMIPVEMNLVETMLEMLESQVGGFYDPATESFYLMDSFTGPLAKVILSHELTHALDDQLYDIDGTRNAFKTNSDRTLAYHGVVEGSGTAVMNAWSMEHMNELAGVDLEKATSMGASMDVPPYLWRPMMATYLRGSLFLNRTDSLLGSFNLPDLENFHYAFTEPPRSTEQLLHPEKYWNPKKQDEPLLLGFDVESLPGGWSVLKEDTVGELVLACMIEKPENRKGLPTSSIATLSTKYTFRASEGWGGDRLLLLGKDKARLLVLETRWDTEDDAREFDAALGDLEEHLRSSAAGLAGEAGPSGVLRLFDRAGKAVTFYSWFGAERSEVARVISMLRVESKP